MFNLCSMCSNLPQPGQYAYQVFRKIPNVGGIIGMMNNFNQGGMNWGNGRGNGRGMAPNLTQFINNNPLDSTKGEDSNLKDVIQKNEHKDVVVKKIMKSNYNELITKHRQEGTKWTDPDFPPDQSSIGSVQNVPVRATWKRIPEVIKHPQFISGHIEPSDILQGSIGDCYFLSAISALAQNDFRIKNLFPSLDINARGIYMARIMYQGILKEVVVDDYIPVTPQGTPLFAKPAGGRQVWVMILQKCWAKLHGSYGAIVGGLPNEVLHAFSGAPTYYHPIPTSKEKQQQLRQKIVRAEEDGHILCCGTKGDTSIEKAGLVLGHAYTLIAAYDNPYKLLKLRNPWGRREWNGRASDDDNQFWSRISAGDKQRLKYQKGNDGIFFMLWQDFVNYFDMVDICKVNDNASYINVDTEFNNKNGEVFDLQTESCEITVGLSQTSLRGASSAIEKKGLSRTTIVVAKHESTSKGYQYKYINSNSSKLFAQHYLHLPKLVKGKYIIYAKCDWVRQQSDIATVSIYTEGKATLIKSKQSKHDKFLYKTFLDHARKNSKLQTLSKQPSEWVCSDFLLNKGGYGYLAIHLDEKSQRKIGVELSEKDFIEKRLVLKKPYKGKEQIKTMVQPGKELIILYRMKANNYPSSITLPTPKIYNLV